MPLLRGASRVLQAFVNRFAELLAEANGQERSPAGREIEGMVTQFGVWAAAATYDSNAIKMRELLYGKLEEGAGDCAPLTQLVVSHPAALALREVGCAADCSPRLSLPACSDTVLRPHWLSL